MPIEAFTGQVGSPEHAEWSARAEALSAAAVEQRRAYMIEMGWPWPKRYSKSRKPHPGLVDYKDPEEG